MADQTLDDAPIWSDLATFDGGAWRGAVDIVLAGFPCQPASVAGKRRGADDERWLWPHVWRIFRECGARMLIFENVGGLRSKNLLGQILVDMAKGGLTAEWTSLSAAEVGASHIRERLFCVAVANPGSCGRDGRALDPQRQSPQRTATQRASSEVADAGCERDYAGQHGRLERESRQGAASAGAGREAVAHTAGERLGGDGQRNGHAVWSSRPRGYDANGCDQAVADAEGDGRQQGRAKPAVLIGRHGPLGGGCEVGDADESRRQGRLGAVAERSDERTAWRPSSALADTEGVQGLALVGAEPDADGLGIFAPGPSEFDVWRRVLEVSPHLEPAICNVAHGLADRIHQLRAAGNGVVPLQAAAAITHLLRRHLDLDA